MNAAARLLGLLATTLGAAAPVLALAQAADRPAAGPHGYGWLWLLAAGIVVIALFRLFSARSRPPPPPTPPTAP